MIIKNVILDYFYSLKSAAKIFIEKDALQMAASSSFYVILTVVPFFLLMCRLLGILLGDIDEIHAFIFTLSKEAFPDVAPEVLIKVKNIVRGPLLANGSFTFINFLILLVSSLSFFNSIWVSLRNLSEDLAGRFWVKHLLGVAVIGFTVLLVFLTFSIQPFVQFFIKILKYNVMTELIYQNFEWSKEAITYLRGLDSKIIFPIRSNLFQFFFFFIYFTILYSWFFKWKIKKRVAFVASGTFVSLMILGKSLFWVYFFTLRGRFIESYGDYYTVVVAAFWLYLVMCFFYFGACLCVDYLKKRTVLVD